MSVLLVAAVVAVVAAASPVVCFFSPRLTFIHAHSGCTAIGGSIVAAGVLFYVCVMVCVVCTDCVCMLRVSGACPLRLFVCVCITHAQYTTRTVYNTRTCARGRQQALNALRNTHTHAHSQSRSLRGSDAAAATRLQAAARGFLTRQQTQKKRA